MLMIPGIWFIAFSSRNNLLSCLLLIWYSDEDPDDDDDEDDHKGVGQLEWDNSTLSI